MPHGDAEPDGEWPARLRQGGGDQAGRAAREGRPPVPRSGDVAPAAAAPTGRRGLASPGAGSIPCHAQVLATPR